MSKLTNVKMKMGLKATAIFFTSLLLAVCCVGIFGTRRKVVPVEMEIEKQESGPLGFSVDYWNGKSNRRNFSENYAKRGVKTYTINSAESFAYFVDLANSEYANGSLNHFEGYTIYLNKSLDLDGRSIDSIKDFRGTFDGGYYTIYNAKINGNGLFENTHNATIKNIGLYNVEIKGEGEYVGGLIAEAENTNILDSYVRLGKVEGKNYVGGLVGKFAATQNIVVENSFVDAQIIGQTNGGLIGYVEATDATVTIKNSYYTQNGLYGEIAEGALVDSSTNVIKPQFMSDFDSFDYVAEFNVNDLDKWCDYSAREGARGHEFNYPILARFNKVFMNGSYYESVAYIYDEDQGKYISVDSSDLAESLNEIREGEEAEYSLIVGKVYMTEQAVVPKDAEVTINLARDVELVRNVEDVAVDKASVLVASEGATLTIGKENQKRTLTIDGQKTETIANETNSSALVSLIKAKDFNVNGALVLKNNVNNIGSYGGAMIVDSVGEDETFDLKNIRIENCSMPNGNGGAIGIVDSNVSLSNVIVKGCDATNGGAIYVGASSGLSSVDFAIRNAYSSSRYTFLTGESESEYDIVIDNCLLESNSATNGGAISNTVGADILIRGGQMLNNSASGNGGAIYNVSGGTIALERSAPISNTPSTPAPSTPESIVKSNNNSLHAFAYDGSSDLYPLTDNFTRSGTHRVYFIYTDGPVREDEDWENVDFTSGSVPTVKVNGSPIVLSSTSIYVEKLKNGQDWNDVGNEVKYIDNTYSCYYADIAFTSSTTIEIASFAYTYDWLSSYDSGLNAYYMSGNHLYTLDSSSIGSFTKSGTRRLYFGFNVSGQFYYEDWGMDISCYPSLRPDSENITEFTISVNGSPVSLTRTVEYFYDLDGNWYDYYGEFMYADISFTNSTTVEMVPGGSEVSADWLTAGSGVCALELLDSNTLGVINSSYSRSGTHTIYFAYSKLAGDGYTMNLGSTPEITVEVDGTPIALSYTTLASISYVRDGGSDWGDYGADYAGPGSVYIAYASITLTSSTTVEVIPGSYHTGPEHDLTIANNIAALGGAIYNAGTMKVGDVYIASNSATSNGGAVYNTGTMAVGDAELPAGNGLSESWLTTNNNHLHMYVEFGPDWLGPVTDEFTRDGSQYTVYFAYDNDTTTGVGLSPNYANTSFTVNVNGSPIALTNTSLSYKYGVLDKSDWDDYDNYDQLQSLNENDTLSMYSATITFSSSTTIEMVAATADNGSSSNNESSNGAGLTVSQVGNLSNNNAELIATITDPEDSDACIILENGFSLTGSKRVYFGYLDYYWKEADEGYEISVVNGPDFIVKVNDQVQTLSTNNQIVYSHGVNGIPTKTENDMNETYGGVVFPYYLDITFTSDTTIELVSSKTLNPTPSIYYAGATLEYNHSTGSTKYGAAIYNSGTIAIDGVKFKGNYFDSYASSKGSGIYNIGTATIENTTFVDNIAADGAGIYVSSSSTSTTIESSQFIANNATNGAAIVTDKAITLEDNLFANNDSSSSGGAIKYIVAPTTFVGNTFIENKANNGGAVYSTVALNISNNNFYNNTSYYKGGAVYGEAGVTVSSGTLDGNTTYRGGGAIHSETTVAVTGSAHIDNNTVMGYSVTRTQPENIPELDGLVGNLTISWKNTNLGYATYYSGTLTCANGGSQNVTMTGLSMLENLDIQYLRVRINGGSWLDVSYSNNGAWTYNSTNANALNATFTYLDKIELEIQEATPTYCYYKADPRYREVTNNVSVYKRTGSINNPSYEFLGTYTGSSFATELWNSSGSGSGWGTSYYIRIASGDTKLNQILDYSRVTSMTVLVNNDYPIQVGTDMGYSITFSTSDAVVIKFETYSDLTVFSSALDTGVTVATANPSSFETITKTNEGTHYAWGGAISATGNVTIGESGVANTISISGNIAGTAGMSDKHNSSYGGAIYSQGNVAIYKTTIDHNLARGFATGSYVNVVRGGAVYAAGTVSVNHSTISYSTGNGIDADGTINIQYSTISNNDHGVNTVSGQTVNITDSAFTSNGTTSLDGGAIYVNGATVNISDVTTATTFTNNHASHGGAIYISSAGTSALNFTTATTLPVVFSGNTANSSGGAIYTNKTLTLPTGVSFVNNSAQKSGAVDSSVALTINGATFTGNSATQHGGAINAQSDLTVTNGTFTNNSSTGDGGAIYTQSTLTLTNATFTGNSAGYGGALGIYTGASVTFGTVTFSGNHASQGGAIWNPTIVLSIPSTVSFTGNYASEGGAIYTTKNLTITGTTFTNNYSSDNGGAIYIGGLVVLNVNGATFSGNYAYDSTYLGGGNGNGGAIYGYINGTATSSKTYQIVNSTFTGNYSAVSGGAVYFRNSTTRRPATISLTIDGSTFSSNHSVTGGAIYAERTTNLGNTNVNLINASVFNGNYVSSTSAEVKGGAIYTTSNVTTNVGGTTSFTSNYAGSTSSNAYGGAIYTGGTVNLSSSSNITFEDNYASTTSGDARGGAIYAGTITTTANNNGYTFEDNYVTSTSGGTYGGAIYAGTATLIDVSLAGDATATNAVYGGGLYVNTALTATRLTAEDLKANYGGAIYINDTATSAAVNTITSSTFHGNQAGTYGGALYTDGYNVAIGNATRSTLTINDTDFYSNSATKSSAQGGAIYLKRIDLTTYDTNIGIYDSTEEEYVGNSANNGGGLAVTTSSTVTFGYSNTYPNGTKVQGNTAFNGGGIMISGGSQMTANCFLDVGNNAAKNNGGGIYSATNGFVFAGARVHHNTAVDSAGMSLMGSANFYFGEVDHNVASSTGGGIGFYATAASTYIMSGLKDLQSGKELILNVHDNTANHGGGMYVSRATSSFDTTIVGLPNIYNNRARLKGGGLVVFRNFVCTTATSQALSLTLPSYYYYDANDTLQQTTAATYSYNGATYTFIDGEIHHNTAQTNAGAQFENATITRPLTVHHNTATVNGCGGVGLVGTATMTNCVLDIHDNTAVKGGAGLDIGSGCVATNISGNIYNNETTGTTTDLAYHGAGIRNVGTLALSAGTLNVYNNTTKSHGAGICNANTFTITGSANLNVYGNTANGSRTGGGIYSTMPIEFNTSGNVNIYSNTASAAGGGIYTTAALTLGGTGNINIYSNTATSNGAGIYGNATSSITISNANAEIYSNTATGNGGGIFMASGSTAFTMSAGKIGKSSAGNTATTGGGIYLNGVTTTSITGGEVSYNSATTTGGMYIVNTNSSTTNISSNVHHNVGAGMRFMASGTSTITGGSYHDGASDATTIHVEAGTLNITGGSFYDNEKTVTDVSTIKTASGATLSISGGNFYNNSAKQSAGNVITATGDVTISGGNFYLNSPADNAANTVAGVIYFNGASTKTLSITGGNFYSNSGASSGVIKTGSSSPIVNISGGAFYGNTSSANGGVMNIQSGTTTISGSAKFGLTSTSATTYTDTNGTHSTANSSGSGGVFKIAGGTLVLTGGTISNNTATFGGAIYADGSSTSVSIPSNSTAVINGNISSTYAGAISVGGGATCTVAGGTISNNVVSVNSGSSTGGGAIYVAGTNSTLNISGGTITGNSSRTYGGAIYVASNGTANISGGTISANGSTTLNAQNYYTQNGGAIYNLGTLSITGGTINNNIATTNGGAIYNAGTMTISETASAVTISGNTALLGAGIYTTTAATITGADIIGNIASANAAGIYASHNLTLNGVTITDNAVKQSSGSLDPADYAGGLVMAGTSKTLTLTGTNVIANNQFWQTESSTLYFDRIRNTYGAGEMDITYNYDSSDTTLHGLLNNSTRYDTLNNFDPYTNLPGVVGLPSAYQQVEYIESTGTQYIDCGLVANENTNIELTYQYTTTSLETTGTRVFGSRGNGSVDRAFLIALNDGYWYVNHYNTSNTLESVTWGTVDTKIHTIRNNGGEFYFDDENVITFSTGQFTTPYNVLLLAGNSNNTIYASKSRVYSCKIYDNSTTVRNFVPCYRKSDNVIGLYDTVNGVFYTNAGTGTFKKGSEVYDLGPTYQQVEYVQFDSSSQIILDNVVVNKPTEANIKFYCLENTTNYKFIFTSDIDSTMNSLGSSGSRLYLWYGLNYNSMQTTSYAINTLYNVTLNFTSTTASATINGTTYSAPNSKNALSGGVVKFNGIGRFYSYKISQEGILVADLVPCYRKSDNVIGFYDLVTGNFYTNRLTGTFTKGSDIGYSSEIYPHTYGDYKFAGWATDPTDPSTILDSGDQYRYQLGNTQTTITTGSSESKNLYAMYTKDASSFSETLTHTFYYYDNGQTKSFTRTTTKTASGSGLVYYDKDLNAISASAGVTYVYSALTGTNDVLAERIAPGATKWVQSPSWSGDVDDFNNDTNGVWDGWTTYIPTENTTWYAIDITTGYEYEAATPAAINFHYNSTDYVTYYINYNYCYMDSAWLHNYQGIQVAYEQGPFDTYDSETLTISSINDPITSKGMTVTSGYSLVGWSTENDSTAEWTFGSLEIFYDGFLMALIIDGDDNGVSDTSDYYAVYAKTWSLSKTSENEEVLTDTYAYTTTGNKTKTVTSPTRTGYTFVGWTTSVGLGGTTYIGDPATSTSLTSTSAIMYYRAVWRAEVSETDATETLTHTFYQCDFEEIPNNDQTTFTRTTTKSTIWTGEALFTYNLATHTRVTAGSTSYSYTALEMPTPMNGSAVISHEGWTQQSSWDGTSALWSSGSRSPQSAETWYAIYYVESTITAYSVLTDTIELSVYCDASHSTTYDVPVYEDITYNGYYIDYVRNVVKYSNNVDYSISSGSVKIFDDPFDPFTDTGASVPSGYSFVGWNGSSNMRSIFWTSGACYGDVISGGDISAIGGGYIYYGDTIYPVFGKDNQTVRDSDYDATLTHRFYTASETYTETTTSKIAYFTGFIYYNYDLSDSWFEQDINSTSYSYQNLEFMSANQAGFTFVGWSTANDATAEWTSGTQTPTTDTTWYAVWNGTVTASADNKGSASVTNSYTVDFMTGSGSPVDDQTLNIYSLDVYDVEYQNQNHNYNLTSHAGSSTNVITGTEYSSDGSTDWTTDSATLSWTLDYVTSTLSGYTFAGWSTANDATPEWTNGTRIITGDTTLYAVWNGTCETATNQKGEASAYSTITVAFNTHDGSAVASEVMNISSRDVYSVQYQSQNHSYNLALHAGSSTNVSTGTEYSGDSGSTWGSSVPTLTVEYKTSTRAGYEFLGWATTADGSVSWTSGTKTYNAGDSVTWHAKWQAVNYTISLGANISGASYLATTKVGGTTVDTARFIADTVAITTGTISGYQVEKIEIYSGNSTSGTLLDTINSASGDYTMTGTYYSSIYVYVTWKVQVTLQLSGIKTGNNVTMLLGEGTTPIVATSNTSGYIPYGVNAGLKWTVVEDSTTNSYQIVYLSHNVGSGPNQDATFDASRSASYYFIPALSNEGIVVPTTIIFEFKDAFKLSVDNGNASNKGAGVEVTASSQATQIEQNDGTIDNVISTESTVTIKVTPSAILTGGDASTKMFIGFWYIDSDNNTSFVTNASWNVQLEEVNSANVYTYTVSGNDIKTYKILSVATVTIVEASITRDFSSFNTTITLRSAEGYALDIVPGQTIYQLYNSTWTVIAYGETQYSGTVEQVAYYLNNTIEPQA